MSRLKLSIVPSGDPWKWDKTVLKSLIESLSQRDVHADFRFADFELGPTDPKYADIRRLENADPGYIDGPGVPTLLRLIEADAQIIDGAITCPQRIVNLNRRKHPVLDDEDVLFELLFLDSTSFEFTTQDFELMTDFMGKLKEASVI